MRKITPQELLTLVNSGANVKFPDAPKEDTRVQGMDQLLKIASNHHAQAAERERVLINVMSRLTRALENFDGSDVDLSPLEELVKIIATPKPDYEFTVERNSRGFMTGMTAKTKIN